MPLADGLSFLITVFEFLSCATCAYLLSAAMSPYEAEAEARPCVMTSQLYSASQSRSPPRRRGEWRWCPISTGRHGAQCSQCSLGRAQRSNFVICQQVRDGRPPPSHSPTGAQGNGPRLKIFKLCPGGAIGETKQITL